MPARLTPSGSRLKAGRAHAKTQKGMKELTQRRKGLGLKIIDDATDAVLEKSFTKNDDQLFS
jgi:hypothetical protein